MLKLFKKYPSTFTVVLTIFVLVWVSANLNWGDGRWKRIIRADASSYYGYLPAVFIYNDLTFSYLLDEQHLVKENADLYFSPVKLKNGAWVNKYFIGTAVAQLPFFLAGHALSFVSGKALDGYSSYYLILMQVGAICYVLFALILMIKILRRFGISELRIALLVFAMIFGTNVFYYVVDEPMMSHIYSLAYVLLFIYAFQQFFDHTNTSTFLTGIFALAMIVLIRPVNGMVIFSLPFIAGSSLNLVKLKTYMVRNIAGFILGLIIFTVIVSMQLVVYKIQTGHFWIYSYTGEKLDLFNPNLFKFLFSYRKGLFVYTPIFLIAIFGGYTLWKRNPFQFYSLLLFLFVVSYVLSSWWQWYYGGSFGSRVFIEYYPFLFILIGLWLEFGRLRKMFVSMIFVSIIICQVQTYQYRHGYIHWSDMNQRLYWENFLRLDKVIRKAEKEWE